jgi:nucleotide-binding universal stress UspA family protein
MTMPNLHLLLSDDRRTTETTPIDRERKAPLPRGDAMTESSTQASQELHDASEALQTIVVAIDASANAARVISAAARMSRVSPSPVLHVVHVFRANRFDHSCPGVPTTPANFIEDSKEHLESHVRAARRQCRARVVGHFTFGDPATEVSRLCSELNADLLVIGTHDHHGLERLLLGSIAERLVRKVACAALVVRPKNAR